MGIREEQSIQRRSARGSVRRTAGYPAHDADVVRLPSLADRRINMLGRFALAAPSPALPCGLYVTLPT